MESPADIFNLYLAPLILAFLTLVFVAGAVRSKGRRRFVFMVAVLLVGGAGVYKLRGVYTEVNSLIETRFSTYEKISAELIARRDSLKSEIEKLEASLAGLPVEPPQMFTPRGNAAIAIEELSSKLAAADIVVEDHEVGDVSDYQGIKELPVSFTVRATWTGILRLFEAFEQSPPFWSIVNVVGVGPVGESHWEINAKLLLDEKPAIEMPAEIAVPGPPIRKPWYIPEPLCPRCIGQEHIGEQSAELAAEVSRLTDSLTTMREMRVKRAAFQSLQARRENDHKRAMRYLRGQ